VSTEQLSVLGVPSSAGSYASGQEDAPGALRDAGLIRKINAASTRPVYDIGDLPRYRWRPDRAQPRAQNLDEVVATATRVSEVVNSSLEAGGSLLVLGGDCTIGIGVVAGCVAAGLDPGLVYFDMHTDLNTPSSVIDGALDWMGLAQMLGIEGSVEALRDIGIRSPLLSIENVAVIGFEHSQATEWERDLIDRMGLKSVAADDVRADPHAASRTALDMLVETAGPLVAHFDVDVIDFVDAPLSENTGRNVGITLEHALAVMDDLVDEPRVRVLTITELNPHHAGADPESFARFVTRLARAASRL